MAIPFITLFKKPINSISDEITTKFKTPFFTTYIVIWVIKNNIFIYNLFFNSKISDKSILLEKQFNITDKTFYIEILITLLITLIVLVIFYFFINLSRIITILSEERIKLNILNLLKSKKVSSIDDTNYWKNKSIKHNAVNIKLEEDISTLRSSINFLESELESAQKQLTETIKISDETIDSMKNTVTIFSNSVSATIDNKTIVKMVDLIERANEKYQNSKKPPSFIKV